MTERKLITTYTEYDKDGRIKCQTVTEQPYDDEPSEGHCEGHCGGHCDRHCDSEKCSCENTSYDEECDDDDDNAMYVITPKGIAYLALKNAAEIYEFGTEEFFEDFWERFMDDMIAHNYAEEEEF